MGKLKESLMGKSKEKLEDDSADDCDQPPPYSAHDPKPQIEKSEKGHESDTGGSTYKLSLPTVENTITHLKLLHCFHALRETISNTDGLFGLYDRYVEPSSVLLPAGENNYRATTGKRWSVYVSRAVSRFERWWELQVPAGASPLVVGDLVEGGIISSNLFKTIGKYTFNRDQLPPLDILMVWHAFMLNPHRYLEDCLRHGAMNMWHCGMPWDAIEESINIESASYDPGPAALRVFSDSGMSWKNLDDPDEVSLPCPFHRDSACQLKVPWTTFDKDLQTPSQMYSDVKGKGYADRGFSTVCEQSGEAINHATLELAKFLRDWEALCRSAAAAKVANDESLFQPMRGTVITLSRNPKSEYPRQITAEQNLFPNKILLLRHLTLKSMLDGTATEKFKSLTDIQKMLGEALDDQRLLKKVAPKGGLRDNGRREERMTVRRMMSHYWKNSSIFGIDLVGAVIRQGEFVQKMAKFDWIHSPTLVLTVDKLVRKYERFFALMNELELAVPTLDVDLAWHTHQLTPRVYHAYSLSVCKGVFKDHNDAVGDAKLSQAFEKTCAAYRDRYGEPYSECLCWYCEATRAVTLSTPLRSRIFKSKSPRDPGQPSPEDVPSDPSKSAHISTHNSMYPINATAHASYQRLAKDLHSRLERGYKTARDRAVKAGRPPPEQISADIRGIGPLKLDAEGKFLEAPETDEIQQIAYKGGQYVVVPWMPWWNEYPLLSNDYRYLPNQVNLHVGSYGNCAAGSCGGLVAQGGCITAAAGGCITGYDANCGG